MHTLSPDRVEEHRTDARIAKGRELPADDRKGAVIAVVGVMITVLMMIAAIAVDASRLLAAKNELQTSVDAATLAAAIRLLDSTGGGVSVSDSLMRFVGLNRVQNEQIDSVRVEYGVWRAATRVFAEGDPKDAVRITLKHPVKLTFGRLLGDSVINVSASAIAWSNAPVEETECVKPLALAYARLIEVLDGFSSPPDQPHRSLTDEDIMRLREMTPDQKRRSFYYALNPVEDTIETWEESAYYPLDLDTIWREGDAGDMERASDSTGSRYYRPYLGSECSKALEPGDIVRSEPYGKRGATRDGLSDLCSQKYGGTLSDEGCMVDTGRVEMRVKVAFWSYPAEWTGSNRVSVKIRAVGSWVIHRIERTDSPIGRERDKIYGWFDVQRDWGRVGSAPTTLLRPLLVR